MSGTFMHQKGEYVVYKKRGIYAIEDIRKEKICGELKIYYVLKSVYDQNAAVYVPADCEALVNQMEHVLSKEEIEEIVAQSEKVQTEWIADPAKRREYFDEVLVSENLSRVVSVAKLLQSRKDDAIKTKTKVPAMDERMLSACRKMLEEAFAFSLGIEKRQVEAYILEKTDK